MEFVNLQTGEVIETCPRSLKVARKKKTYSRLMNAAKRKNLDAFITLAIDYGKLQKGVCPACILRKLFKYFLKCLRRKRREVSYIAILEKQKGYYHLHVLARGIRKTDKKAWEKITEKVGGTISFIEINKQNRAKILRYAFKSISAYKDHHENFRGRSFTTSRDIKNLEISKNSIDKWILLGAVRKQGYQMPLDMKICIHGYFKKFTEQFFKWIVKKCECSFRYPSSDSSPMSVSNLAGVPKKMVRSQKINANNMLVSPAPQASGVNNCYA